MAGGLIPSSFSSARPTLFLVYARTREKRVSRRLPQQAPAAQHLGPHPVGWCCPAPPSWEKGAGLHAIVVRCFKRPGWTCTARSESPPLSQGQLLGSRSRELGFGGESGQGRRSHCRAQPDTESPFPGRHAFSHRELRTGPELPSPERHSGFLRRSRVQKCTLKDRPQGAKVATSIEPRTQNVLLEPAPERSLRPFREPPNSR
jgi:hypothetical protein